MIDNPQTDQAALRDRIAEALMRWAEGNNDPQYARMRRSETVRANAYSRADAVLAAVLPAVPVPPATHAADRAAVLCEIADQQTQLAVADDLARRRDAAAARRQLVKELRRMADEAQQQPE